MDLATSDSRIIDLALHYGYESPDSFAKAFRTMFGCTPTEARLPGARLRSYPPITFSIMLKGAQAMDHRIEKKLAFSLTGIPLRTTMKEGQCFKEIPVLWDRCLNDGTVARFGELVPSGSAIGVADVNAEFDLEQGEFTYLVAIETPADRSGLLAGCRDLQVPAATWAMFEGRGAIPEAIQGLMQRICGEWFPSSGWEHARGPELEIYPRGDVRDPDCSSEVWIPVQKAVS